MAPPVSPADRLDLGPKEGAYLKSAVRWLLMWGVQMYDVNGAHAGPEKPHIQPPGVSGGVFGDRNLGVSSRSQGEELLSVVEDTMRRVKRAGLTILPLHTVLPDGTCTCGSPLCLHPGKHGLAAAGVDNNSYAGCPLAGRALLPRPFNIGAPADGYVVLNVDSAYGGYESLQQTFPQLGRTAHIDTWLVGTPGGGFHIWFKLPDGSSLQSEFIFLGPGLSALNGATTYGILPPSLGFRGVAYTWECPEETDIAPIPSWVLPALLAADKREVDGWHVTMTRAEIASYVHKDYCDRFGQVDYELFTDVWDKVAAHIERERIRPESFVGSIRATRIQEVTIPEDLLDPDVLAVRDRYVRAYGPKRMEMIYQMTWQYLHMCHRDKSVADIRRQMPRRPVGAWRHLSDLLRATMALYACPAHSHDDALAAYATAALNELDECDLLGRQLKQAWFVHPEELRRRLKKFARGEAA